MSIATNIQDQGILLATRKWLTDLFFGAAGSEPVKELLRQPVLAPLIGRWLARRARVVHDTRGDNVLNVLVFDAHRYGQDLEALAATGALRFLTIAPDDIAKVFAFFRNRRLVENDDYFCETQSDVLDLRERQVAFLARVGRTLKRQLNLHAAIAPAMHYRHNLPWARALPQAGVPFIAIHKEFTLIDERHIPRRANNYLTEQMRFEGSRLLTTNFTGKKLFELGGLCAPKKIECVGLPRMDRLLRADSQFRKPGKRKIATLFSFGHFSGDLTDIPPLRKAHYFDPARRIGFVELSRDTHAAFARAAVTRPNVEFVIKPQYDIDDWKDEIDRAVQWSTGLKVSEIPNLTIVNEPAPDLIRDSLVTVGLNSTVVIESRILGRPTIVPLFAEAAGKHAENVYFRDYLPLFETPDSPEALQQRIVELVDGAASSQSDDEVLLKKFVRAYVGFDDGRTAERVVNEIRYAINGASAAQVSRSETV